MKIVLASQGFTTAEIAQKTAELAGKSLNDLNVAIINEAYVAIDAGRDQKWIINELHHISEFVKGTVAFVNLRAYDSNALRERINFADLIYIVGGKQIILPKLFRETGFDKILMDVASRKVIFGSSAGANVLGKQIEDVNYWKDQYGSAKEYLAEPSLGMVDFNILPHFEREDHPKRNREVLAPILYKHPFPLYGVKDTQAVFFNHGEISYAGGEPIKFGK